MERCILPPGSNGILPPPPPPGTDDSLTAFYLLYTTCTRMNTNAPAEVASLIADVNEMADSDHCRIDTSGIVSAEMTFDNSRPVGERESHPDVVCIDDDVFVQQAFGNDGATCAGAAASGLCPTLEASGIASRCCISCSDDDGHRRAEELFPLVYQDWIKVPTCPINQLTARSELVSRTCCAGSTCIGNIPQQCTFNCTRVYTSFMTDCHDVLETLLDDEMGKYDSFANLCTNLDVHSLVMALHNAHCWFCGDGEQNEDEECDGGACNVLLFLRLVLCSLCPACSFFCVSLLPNRALKRSESKPACLCR